MMTHGIAAAQAQGYTRKMTVETPAQTVEVLVKPDDDLDAEVRVYNADTFGFGRVKGWAVDWTEGWA